MSSVAAADEFPHSPGPHPRWREGYHFNAYDARRTVGISISAGIRPALDVKEEVVFLHLASPMVFLNGQRLGGEDGLQVGDVHMEIVTPLQQWRIWGQAPFRRAEESEEEEVAFDLLFTSDGTPHGYTTPRGERYEQPGRLQGHLVVGERKLALDGPGVRDHSWEVRDLSGWREWYSMMARFETGSGLSFTWARLDEGPVHDGWWWAQSFQGIEHVVIDAARAGDELEACHVQLDMPAGVLEVKAIPISQIRIPLGPGQGHLTETLVRLQKGRERGFGFLWYGGSPDETPA